MKRKKNHVIVMFVCMNVVKNSYIQNMKASAHQGLCLSLISKNLWQIKNLNMKTFEIVLWLINNRKDMMPIPNIALQVLRTLRTVPSIFPV